MKTVKLLLLGLTLIVNSGYCHPDIRICTGEKAELSAVNGNEMTRRYFDLVYALGTELPGILFNKHYGDCLPITRCSFGPDMDFAWEDSQMDEEVKEAFLKVCDRYIEHAQEGVAITKHSSEDEEYMEKGLLGVLNQLLVDLRMGRSCSRVRARVCDVLSKFDRCEVSFCIRGLEYEKSGTGQFCNNYLRGCEEKAGEDSNNVEILVSAIEDVIKLIEEHIKELYSNTLLESDSEYHMNNLINQGAAYYVTKYGELGGMKVIREEIEQLETIGMSEYASIMQILFSFADRYHQFLVDNAWSYIHRDFQSGCESMIFD